MKALLEAEASTYAGRVCKCARI